MSKLTGVSLKNFQRHESLDLEIDPLVTVLVGGTDAGKSSCIRGVAFALLNKPNSARLVRRKQKGPADVTAIFGDRAVRRVRGKKVNDYYLDGEVYKAFGRDKVPLPPAVADFLNLSGVNFQRQVDGPLWFTATPGEVSRRLNSIVDLAVVDGALAEAGGLVRESANRAKFLRERLIESKRIAGGLDWVPAAVAKWDRVKEAETRLTAIRTRIAQVAELSGAATSLRETRDRALHAKLGAKKALSAGIRHRKAVKRLETVDTLVRELEQLSGLANTKLPDLNLLIEIRAECDAVAERRREVDLLMDELLAARTERCRLTERRTELLAAEERRRPATCKTCGQVIGRKSP